MCNVFGKINHPQKLANLTIVQQTNDEHALIYQKLTNTTKFQEYFFNEKYNKKAAFQRLFYCFKTSLLGNVYARALVRNVYEYGWFLA